MITIIYDPYSHLNLYPDALLEQSIRKHMEKEEDFTISTVNSIDMIRLLIKRGEFSNKDYQFYFEGSGYILIDKFGSLSEYPDGFGDLSIEILAELAGFND